MKSHHGLQRAVRWLFVPTSFSGCCAGIAVVTVIGLLLLSMHEYFPANADPVLALGVPSLGGAALMYCLYRVIQHT